MKYIYRFLFGKGCLQLIKKFIFIFLPVLVLVTSWVMWLDQSSGAKPHIDVQIKTNTLNWIDYTENPEDPLSGKMVRLEYSGSQVETAPGVYTPTKGIIVSFSYYDYSENSDGSWRAILKGRDFVIPTWFVWDTGPGL